MKSHSSRLRRLSKTLFVPLLGLSFLLTACSGGAGHTVPPSTGGGGPATASVDVSITPSTATVSEGSSLTFVATVIGATNTTVRWSVQEGTAGGSITSSGYYTAPSMSGTYHVIATSVADATASASAAVVTSEGPLGSFTAVANMTAARAAHTATLLQNGKVLIVGGVGDGSGHALATAELYDLSTRTFTPTGSMITPRYAHSATLLADGRVLIVGGAQDRSQTPILTAEIYDPSTGAFTGAGDLTSFGGEVYAGPGDVTTLLPDGRVFVAAANNAEIYDPNSGTFTPTGPYAAPSLAYGTTVTLLTNGKVLVTACVGSPACSVGATQLFDPQSGTFGVTGPMTAKYYPDYGYTATLLMNGRVLFIGNNDPTFPADVELYDPTAGTFASIANGVSQDLAPAVRLADGTVLVTGGQLGNGSTSTELYLPASGTFQASGLMVVGRDSHAATLLSDGTVLITGGFSEWPAPTDTAEIYEPASP